MMVMHRYFSNPWCGGHHQIVSHEAYVHQSLISEINIKWKKLKSFVTRKIYYFEHSIFSFNPYVYHLTHGFVASTRDINLPTRAFNLVTPVFELVTCGFEVGTRGFKLVIC